MKWEVITNKQRHIVAATSGSEAILRVKSVDVSEIKSVKVAPANATGKIKQWIRNFWPKR